MWYCFWIYIFVDCVKIVDGSDYMGMWNKIKFGKIC